MPRYLLIFTAISLLLSGTTSALSQSAPAKPRSPGEIAAADRIAMEKRAVCQREAQAKKLSFMQRRTYVKSCVKR
ncbi:MAG: hypothetical protein WA445_07890 [Pseudolabrys sp.]